MVQNRSTAVMQRRRVAPDSLDYFPTPPFATRALCRFLVDQGEQLAAMSCWEPACGEMHMVRPLVEYFGVVRASDVHDYGGHERIDFLFNGFDEPPVDWIITNPPFRLAEPFIQTARDRGRRGVAMLLRAAFLEGQDRYHSLFRDHPPAFVLQFTERVCMLEGRLVQIGAIDPFADRPGTKASSATSYCWFVWWAPPIAARTRAVTELRWIAPCRRALELPGDYPDYGAATVDEPMPMFGTENAA